MRQRPPGPRDLRRVGTARDFLEEYWADLPVEEREVRIQAELKHLEERRQRLSKARDAAAYRKV